VITVAILLTISVIASFGLGLLLGDRNAKRPKRMVVWLNIYHANDCMIAYCHETESAAEEQHLLDLPGLSKRDSERLGGRPERVEVDA
jgi:hypothetical protein